MSPTSGADGVVRPERKGDHVRVAVVPQVVLVERRDFSAGDKRNRKHGRLHALPLEHEAGEVAHRARRQRKPPATRIDVDASLSLRFLRHMP